MKKMFSLLILLTAILGCSNRDIVTKDEICPMYYSLSGKIENGVRVIDVKAYKFGFNPDIIVVNSGEKVRLRLTSLDVAHGFKLEELGINERIEPGKESVVEFYATEAGTYEFKCSVFCGSGHLKMRGWLVVK
ncbi:cupredoxin domain-containing protein [uncultured Ilyobacter sp.]|uniref:cupredoxin domain-containing protein n=1 Tax=uncultured Ilyobacter sp. TaxID=544433 RepID=UPI0029C7E837|nr:cupredoxin domain-containing protein [uncultured Ilyobacter sp.]